ncbi:MAG: hypothetical protein K0R67_112 [Paenibacillus sp.]|nr:hypothetical protein [Paenibacillus sp.]
MEDIIESQFESVVPIFFAALFSFIFANFFVVVVGLLVIVFAILFFVLKTKHSHTTRLLKQAAQLQQETAAQLSGVLVSADTFRDLDLGLAEGETEGRLRHMQESALALHQQSQQLADKLKANRPAFFSLLEPLHQAKASLHEAEDLHRRVQRYLHDMSGIGQSLKNTNQQMRQMDSRLKAVTELVVQLKKETEFPLDALQEQLDEATLTFNQLDQLTAFDSLQAEPRLSKLGRSIDALQQRTEEHRKNFMLFREMLERVKRAEDRLQQQVGEGLLSVQEADLSGIMQRKNEIVAQVETRLRAGRQVDLRAAALDIEAILREASESESS